MAPRRDRTANRRRSLGEGAQPLSDTRAFYKAQLERLVERFGGAHVREFGGRTHAHGHNRVGIEQVFGRSDGD